MRSPDSRIITTILLIIAAFLITGISHSATAAGIGLPDTVHHDSPTIDQTIGATIPTDVGVGNPESCELSIRDSFQTRPTIYLAYAADNPVPDQQPTGVYPGIMTWLRSGT